MEKSIIGRKYEVKDNSYACDLSGTCARPYLYEKICIIITQPYIKEVNGRRHLFVNVVCLDKEYPHHYRVLFYEWGLLGKQHEQLKITYSTLPGCTYYAMYNNSDCRLVSDLTVKALLSKTECTILSEIQTIVIPSCGSDTYPIQAIKVRSNETGLEYYVPYERHNIVNYKPDAEPQPWKFCPYCGKLLH